MKIQLSKIRCLSQGVSLLVILSLCLPVLSFAFQPSSYPASVRLPLLDGRPVELPGMLGTITRTFSGATRRTVIVIEDLHCQAEVQENIYWIIEYFQREHACRLVAEEGASQEINMESLRALAPAWLKNEACDYFMRYGRLTGAEKARTLTSQPMMLQGIDDKVLYDADYQAAMRFLNLESQGYISDLREAMKSCRGRMSADKPKKKTQEQFKLEVLEKRLDVMERLLSISATPEEVQSFLQAPEAWNVETFLKALCAPEVGRDLRDVLRLDDFLREVRTFYQLAHQRSRRFVENTLAAMDKQASSSAMLICGGFHTPDLQHELEARGVSYLVIKPRITREDAPNPYFSVLQKQKTPLEKVLWKNAVTLAPHSEWEGKISPELRRVLDLIERSGSLTQALDSLRSWQQHGVWDWAQKLVSGVSGFSGPDEIVDELRVLLGGAGEVVAADGVYFIHLKQLKVVIGISDQAGRFQEQDFICRYGSRHAVVIRNPGTIFSRLKSPGPARVPVGDPILAAWQPGIGTAAHQSPWLELSIFITYLSYQVKSNLRKMLSLTLPDVVNNAKKPRQSIRTNWRDLKGTKFRKFFWGQSISRVGDMVQDTSGTWVIISLTHSAFLLGLQAALTQITLMVLTPLAGVFLDRWNRKRALLITQIGLMFRALVFAALLLSGAVRLWQVLSLALIQGVLAAFEYPAREALIIDMAGDHAAKATALSDSVSNFAYLVGPLLAGALILLVGVGNSYLFNGLSFIFVIYTLYRMKLIHAPDPKRVSLGDKRVQERVKITLDELHGNLKFIAGQVVHRTILLNLGAIRMLGSAYYIILTILAVTFWHGGPLILGLFFAGDAVGMTAASLMLAKRSSARGLEYQLPLATIMLALSLMGIILFPGGPVFISILLIGFNMGFTKTASNMLLKDISHEKKQGRLMGLSGSVQRGFPFVGSLIGGAAVLHFGATSVLAAISVMSLFVAAFFLYHLFSKNMRGAIQEIYRKNRAAPGVTDAENILPDDRVRAALESMTFPADLTRSMPISIGWLAPAYRLAHPGSAVWGARRLRLDGNRKILEIYLPPWIRHLPEPAFRPVAEQIIGHQMRRNQGERTRSLENGKRGHSIWYNRLRWMGVAA